jgi:hypothetical protein
VEFLCSICIWHSWMNKFCGDAAVVRQWTHTAWKMSMDILTWCWPSLETMRRWDDEWMSHVHWHLLLGTLYSIKGNGFIGKTNTCSKQLRSEIACECHHPWREQGAQCQHMHINRWSERRNFSSHCSTGVTE